MGHQVASDYIRLMSDVGCGSSGYGGVGEEIDRELVSAPIKSEIGKKYLSAMACAANFAFANKQIITHFVREDMKNYFPDFEAEVVYDVCHNIAKFEEFDNVVEVGGIGAPSLIQNQNRLGQALSGCGAKGKRKVLVMRKGATRSFGPGRKEIPEDYREVGQPVLIPGSMGTSSYVLVGTKRAEEISWGSTAHGAGRVRSRSEAKKKMSFEEAKADMEKRGVFVEFGSDKGMVEESPFSYKDIDEVVRVSDEAGLSKRVVRLRPLIVVIG